MHGFFRRQRPSACKSTTRKHAFEFQPPLSEEFAGRLLLDVRHRELLAALTAAEGDDWYLDGDGERLPTDQLFARSPWSCPGPGNPVKVLCRWLDLRDGSARFSTPESYGSAAEGVRLVRMRSTFATASGVRSMPTTPRWWSRWSSAGTRGRSQPSSTGSKCWWGVTTDERRFRAGRPDGWALRLGGEAVGQLADAEVAVLVAETAERLWAAGIEGPPAWHFQFEPDR